MKAPRGSRSGEQGRNQGTEGQRTEVIPERAFSVKGRLADFFARHLRESRFGLFLLDLRIWFRSLIDTVMLSRLSCRSFPCGSTPIHPFVDTPAFRGSRSGPVMNLTPDYSAATVSSALGRLNQRDARQARLSPLTSSDWPLCWRGPLPGQEGPMQPSRLIPFPLDSFSRGSR